MDLFERATRRQFRFETPKGLISVEEVWQLPLEAPAGRASLDALAVALDAKVNAAPRKSFVNATAGVDPDTRAKFDIVLHVINVKSAERTAAADERARSEEIQKIMGLIAEQDEAELRSMPKAALQERLQRLLKPTAASTQAETA